MREVHVPHHPLWMLFFTIIGCFCFLWISSVVCDVHNITIRRNPEPSLTHLNMTSHNMRELAINFLGKEVALSIDDDLTTLEQCKTKESQVAFLRVMRDKHESLRSLKKHKYVKLFQLSNRAYGTILAKELKGGRFRSHVKPEVTRSMVTFLTKPGINLLKSNKALADEYRCKNEGITEISMRKFGSLLAEYKKKAKEVYVNNVYHAIRTCLHLDA